MQKEQQFVESICLLNFELCFITNVNQFGFVKELRSACSLAPVSICKIKKFVKNVLLKHIHIW